MSWLIRTICIGGLIVGLAGCAGPGNQSCAPTRKTIREATKVVVAALPDVPESAASINRIRTGYQVKFQQQLVGMTVERTCGTF